MPDRDQSVDRMLRQVMSDGLPPAPQTCVDGETLAAWSEGTLRRAEASAVEAHVADCARCRALMAAFVRTTPAEPVAESLWRRWHLAWVVPLATAATAAAIWVAIPDNGGTSRTSAPTSASAADRSAGLPAALEEQGFAQRPDAPQEKARVAESASNELRQRSDSRGQREVLDQQAAAPAAVAPVAPPPAPVASPLAGAAAERDAAETRKEASVNTAIAPPLAAQRRAFVADQIASPDGSTRWRIVAGQRLERSTDAGVQWTPAAIDAPERLNAGAAPSAAVCWIVGARGAVYLTTDGARFVRLPFTEIIDLTSVFATDALSATVTSADGRSWRTTDQGQTWAAIR